MTANELADEIEDYEYEIGVKFSKTIGTMLRQQAQEINNLKQDLKWAKEQWEKDRINLVHQMGGKDVEIENLKSKVSYWKGLHK